MAFKSRFFFFFFFFFLCQRTFCVSAMEMINKIFEDFSYGFEGRLIWDLILSVFFLL